MVYGSLIVALPLIGNRANLFGIEVSHLNVEASFEPQIREVGHLSVEASFEPQILEGPRMLESQTVPKFIFWHGSISQIFR